MASQQQPPYPMQPQSRPPAPSSPMGGPPPTSYRPPISGAVPGQPQQQQHPGMSYRASGTPPPPGSPMMRPPGFRPGMPPQQQQQQQRTSQPGMPMTPPLANTTPMYQQQAGVAATLAGSPVPRPRTPPVLGATTHSVTGSPPPVLQSPTVSAGSSAPQSPITEQHHRTARKRMYPDQITKAYMDQPAGQMDSFSSPGYQQPQSQPQQQQFQQHSPVPTMTAQTYPGTQQPQQPQFQQPMGGQMNALAGQFGGMNVSSPQVSFSLSMTNNNNSVNRSSDKKN